MNRHTLIVIICSIVIVATVAYSASNLLFVDSLQFRWAGMDDFSLFSLVYGGTFEVCNPTNFPISFQRYSIQVINDKELIGTFVLEGDFIPPQSSRILIGSFDTDSKTIAGVTSLLMDTELKGTQVMRLDAKKVYVQTNTETMILGFIPISTSTQFSGYGFFDEMNKNSEEFEC
jgi:LEA14-like dessication related protein